MDILILFIAVTIGVLLMMTILMPFLCIVRLIGGLNNEREN